MQLLDLHEDVVDAIISWLTSAELFTLSFTCQSLRTPARTAAISSMRLELSHAEEIAQFLAIFDAGDTSYVRDVRILAGYAKSGDTDTSHHPLAPEPQLARLLARTRNLRRLSIAGSDSLLADSPLLQSALSELRSLEHLELSGMESKAVESIGALRCLRSLGLLYAYDSDSTAPLFSSLRALQCVESLKLGFIPADVCRGLAARPVDCTWPAVRELYLPYSSDVPLAVLAQAFPNVEFLHLRCTTLAGTAGAAPWWPRLRKVCGYHSDFAAWPDGRPVHWLVLEPSQVVSTGDTACGVTRGVELLSPAVLSFDVLAGTARGFWAELVRVGRTLRYVDVVLIDGPMSSVFFHFLEVVPRLLRALGIVCLRLRVVGHVAEHVAAVARSLQAIPSLQYFGVGFAEEVLFTSDLSREFRGEVDWWRVSGAGAERTTSALPRHIGEALSEYVCNAQEWPSKIDENHLPRLGQ